MKLKLSNLGVTTSKNAAQLASMGGSIGTVVLDGGAITDLNGFSLRFVPAYFSSESDESELSYPRIAFTNVYVTIYEDDNGNNFFLV